jgi:hypothetical protein
MAGVLGRFYCVAGFESQGEALIMFRHLMPNTYQARAVNRKKAFEAEKFLFSV